MHSQTFKVNQYFVDVSYNSILGKIAYLYRLPVFKPQLVLPKIILLNTAKFIEFFVCNLS